jgi:hypothetical protein
MNEDLLNKLKNFKVNGNHLMIMSLVKAGESVKEFAWTFQVKMAEFQYLVRKGLMEIERVGNTFDFENASLTKLGEKMLGELESYISTEGVSTSTEKVDKIKKEEDLEWLEEWRDLFKDKKPGGAGNKQGCYKKMKVFLKENPDVTKEEIFAAAEAYFESLDSLKYMQQADYFISKGTGQNVSSRLSQWVEYVKEEGTQQKQDWHETI